MKHSICGNLGISIPFLVFYLTGCTGGGNSEQFAFSYDLVTNFALAEVPKEVTAIDFDIEAARRHFRGGWGMAEPGSAWGLGEKSALEFFLLTPNEMEMNFRCSPFVFTGSPPQSISIMLNGEEVEQTTLEPRMQEYRVTLPQHMLLAGDNRLEFHYAYARRPVDVRPGTIDARPYAVFWDDIRFETADKPPRSQAHADPETGTLYIPFGVAVNYYLRLPETSVLTFNSLDLQENPTGRLHVSIQPEGEDERLLATFEASGGYRVLPLSGDSTQITRLSFRATSADQAKMSSGAAQLERPAIRSHNLPPRNRAAIASGGRVSPPDSQTKPNIIIYLVDALRADHLGCYGYRKPISPRIDAFASEAIIFENAVAQGPHTKATVASIFTGVWPGTHGVTKWKDALADDAMTLAEILSIEAYSAAAFTTSAMTINAGFEQGFDDFLFLPSKNEGRMNASIFEWLDSRRGADPFFLYVHTIEPHAPYLPPERFRQRFAHSVKPPDLNAQQKAFLHTLFKKKFGMPSRKTPEFGSRVWVDALLMNEFTVTPALIENMVSLYDAEVAHSDQNFGAFLDGLNQRDLYRNTLIIFLADHGEEFYDHEYWEHGETLYSEVLNIPLIVKPPTGRAGAETRNPHLAQQIDIVPTILDYLNLEKPGHIEGRSLRTLTATEENGAQTRRAFSYLHNGRDRVGASVIEWPWKLIWNWVPGLSVQLFHQEHDPHDKVDLSEQHPVLVGYLVAQIKAQEQEVTAALTPKETVISEELRQKLKSLGYIK